MKKTNSYIATRFPNGSYHTSPKYGVLQCGEFLNNEFLAYRVLGNYLADAKADIKQFPVDTPWVGDCVYLDYGTSDKTGSIPHKAIIDSIDENAGEIWVTEANFKGAGIVSHGRVLSASDKKKIIGYTRVPLNDKTQAAQPVRANAIPNWAAEIAEKAKAKGVITHWDDPFDVVGGERMEWIFEKLGLLDPAKHEGNLTLVRFAVILDRLNLL